MGDHLVRTNVDGTKTLLDACVAAGVPRVLLASSLHAVGYVPAVSLAEAPVLCPRPDSYYGWSKVAIEALGSLYADRFGMTVVSARLGTVSSTRASRVTCRRGCPWGTPPA